MSGMKSRNKGKRGERFARKKLKELGYTVEWTAFENEPDLWVRERHHPTTGDLIDILDEHWEVKFQAGISKKLWDYLDEKSADCLMVKRVKKGEGPYDWLVIRRLK